MEATSQSLAFIARQPILNTHQEIVAYQLLFRDSAEAKSAVIVDTDEASARILVNTLSDIGTQGLLEDKSAFILVDTELLNNELLELLPPSKTVLELLESVVLDEATLQRCQALRQAGYKIAVRDDPTLHNEVNPAVSRLVDYVKIDVHKVGVEQAAIRFKNYQFLSKKMIAEKVETREIFEACKKIGFQFVQGYYFAQPQIFTAKVINPAFVTVVELLNLVSNDVDMKLIEDAFKRDPALSFKLLRYINSVGFGLSCEIQSIRHALTVIGTKQLFRWLTLLMVTAGQNSISSALMKTSIIRGRLTELLGESYFGKAGQDNLFTIGVFSLLDVMLGMPMDEVLSKIDLPEVLSDALLNRQGMYGPFLSLTEACEAGNEEKLRAVASALYINPADVNRCHMSAISWAESFALS
ncbi:MULTISPECIES: EAL and HDOD domain-containing protein [Methylotenera]|uniref:EAL and HDOD domain-containing protein n=1 Tax=Methylotenera TaxID=359407 RepID=UPI00036CA931|nr:MULTISPECIES: EAL domain-containing protein [Methylotenera]